MSLTNPSLIATRGMALPKEENTKKIKSGGLMGVPSKKESMNKTSDNDVGMKMALIVQSIQKKRQEINND